jgi:hypothetical protein
MKHFQVGQLKANFIAGLGIKVWPLNMRPSKNKNLDQNSILK